MTATFYEKPVLNSPYSEPSFHHALDEEGQPTDQPPIDGRRRSELMTPVPKPRKRRKTSEAQSALELASSDGISSEKQECNPTPIINEIRSDNQKKVIELDYGMVAGKVKIKVCRAMLYYALKRLGLDTPPGAREPRDQQIVLLNDHEVLPTRGSAG